MRERPLSMQVAGGDVTLTGSVDEGSVDALRSLLIELAQGGEPVRVRLSEVDYLPSFAIGVLAKARAEATRRGVTFDLVAAAGTPAQRVLDIAAIPHDASPGDVGPLSPEGLDAS